MATISSEATKEDVIKMVEAGMNIARFDASNGKEDFEKVENSLKALREAIDEYNEKRRDESEQQELSQVGNEEKSVKYERCPNVHIATALDLKGSYYETGILAGNDSISLTAGSPVALTSEASKERQVNGQCIYVNYPNLMSLNANQLIIVNKEIKLSVGSIDSESGFMNCVVVKGGDLSPNMRMEVNIPGIKTTPPMNEALIPSINFCKQMGIDMIIAPILFQNAFSMIKCVVNLDGALNALKVVAKLEGGEAVSNIDKILERADGVMISRSRLGRNVSPGHVIIYQKTILSKSLKAGIPTIVSGDILNSFEENHEATRAEIADVVNSVFDGADCIMLEEKVSTPGGIETMSNSILEAEDMINYRRLHWDLVSQVEVPSVPIPSRDFVNSTAIAACTAAMLNGANAIVALTETGKTAQMISKYRPECPIVCVTRCPVVARQVLMYRGVFSITFEGNVLSLIEFSQAFKFFQIQKQSIS